MDDCNIAGNMNAGNISTSSKMPTHSGKWILGVGRLISFVF
jgi:hypothetical protein